MIETNLETKIFLIFKMVSNLVTITTNYFLSLKICFYFMIFLYWLKWCLGHLKLKSYALFIEKV